MKNCFRKKLSRGCRELKVECDSVYKGEFFILLLWFIRRQDCSADSHCLSRWISCLARRAVNKMKGVSIKKRTRNRSLAEQNWLALPQDAPVCANHLPAFKLDVAACCVFVPVPKPPLFTFTSTKLSCELEKIHPLPVSDTKPLKCLTAEHRKLASRLGQIVVSVTAYFMQKI